MTEKRRLTLYLVGYCVLFVLLASLGIVHNQHAYYEQIQSLSEDKSSLLTTVVILGLIYAVRCSLILLPLKARDIKWQRVLRYGIYFCIIPELIGVFTAIGLLTKQASDCQEVGLSSPCNNAFAVFVVALSFSFVLQLLGMTIGFLVAKFKK